MRRIGDGLTDSTKTTAAINKLQSVTYFFLSGLVGTVGNLHTC